MAAPTTAYVAHAIGPQCRRVWANASSALPAACPGTPLR